MSVQIPECRYFQHSNFLRDHIHVFIVCTIHRPREERECDEPKNAGLLKGCQRQGSGECVKMWLSFKSPSLCGGGTQFFDGSSLAIIKTVTDIRSLEGTAGFSNASFEEITTRVPGMVELENRVSLMDEWLLTQVLMGEKLHTSNPQKGMFTKQEIQKTAAGNAVRLEKTGFSGLQLAL